MVVVFFAGDDREQPSVYNILYKVTTNQPKQLEAISEMSFALKPILSRRFAMAGCVERLFQVLKIL